MRLRLAVVVVASLALVAVPSVAGGDTSRVKATGTPGSFKWQPGFKHIYKGDRIVWKNTTSSNHRVVAYSDNWSKNSEIESNGGRTAKKFRKTGSYLYRCTVPGHSAVESGECEGMCGEIHVARR
jgi:plastocyanin